MKQEKELFAQVANALVIWYHANKRIMPWRAEPTPYHVWISEIMLQQTRIEAVIPYYDRFLRAFPDVQTLAETDEDRLLKYWEGLGYYSRARNLKKAAGQIIRDHGGRLPQTAAELKKLPGIGDYTAGAIASIAYGKPEPAVDGNVLRVLSRVAACPDDIMLPATRKAMTEQLRAIYPAGQDASDLTQGIMELGETVCLPNAVPRCEICPLQGCCRAHSRGVAMDFPVKSPKKARKIERKSVFLLLCDGRYALHRRDSSGLLANLWEFPNIPGHATMQEIESYLRECGLHPLAVTPCGKAKHIFTHVEWHMTGYLVTCEQPGGDFVWKTAEEILTQYAIPTAFRAFTSLIK